MLDMSKVLLFVKSLDMRDCESVGLLLETNDGVTVDWTVVKGVCGMIDKHSDWKEKGFLSAGLAVETRAEPISTLVKETRRWLELA